MAFLFVDKILELTPGKYVKGIKQVTSHDYYLTQDERGNLTFIPSLIGETLGQLAAWNVMLSNDFTLRPVAGIAASAKLIKPAPPGSTVILESFIDRLDEQQVEYHSEARIDNELVFSIDGALGPLLPMDDFIERQVVKQQFEAIYQLDKIPSPTAAVNHSGIQLGFDRISSFEKGESITAELTVSPKAPWFADHFPKKPVLPMTVFLEKKINLARDFVKLSQFPVQYQVSELRKIKMNEFIQPGQTVITRLQVKSISDEALIITFRSTVAEKRVCVLEMLLRAQ